MPQQRRQFRSVGAEHDSDRVSSGFYRACDGGVQQWPAIEPNQLFGRAETHRGAGRQYQDVRLERVDSASRRLAAFAGLPTQASRVARDRAPRLWFRDG